MFSSGGRVSSKFSHLSTAIRATGRSNPISINVVTIGGVGDLATGGRGDAGGGRGGAGGGGGAASGGDINLGPAGGRFAPLGRGTFLGGTTGGGAGGVGCER